MLGTCREMSNRKPVSKSLNIFKNQQVCQGKLLQYTVKICDLILIIAISTEDEDILAAREVTSRVFN